MSSLRANVQAVNGWRKRYEVRRSLPIPAILVEQSINSSDADALCLFSTLSNINESTGRASMWQQYATMHNKTRDDLMRGNPNHGKLLMWHCFDEETCGGTGDQFKGIASALYFAILSNRTLFINWNRNGKDMADIFPPQSIDWQVPHSLQISCEEQGSFNVQDSSGRGLITALESDAPCLSMNTNWDPDSFLTSLAMGTSRELRDPVSKTYLTGCAAHFLFSFQTAYQDLAANVRLLMPGQLTKPPVQYVAVHLRFPDAVFAGKVSIHKAVVNDALHCASLLGSKLFGVNDNWGIFFSSDSTVARELAWSSAFSARVFETDLEPMHSDLNKTASSDVIWHSLGDELLIARAQGVIQCDSRMDHCHNSGFSRVAGQLGFIPLSRVKDSVDKGACHNGRLT